MRAATDNASGNSEWESREAIHRPQQYTGTKAVINQETPTNAEPQIR